MPFFDSILSYWGVTSRPCSVISSNHENKVILYKPVLARNGERDVGKGLRILHAKMSWTPGHHQVTEQDWDTQRAGRVSCRERTRSAPLHSPCGGIAGGPFFSTCEINYLYLLRRKTVKNGTCMSYTKETLQRTASLRCTALALLWFRTSLHV